MNSLLPYIPMVDDVTENPFEVDCSYRNMSQTEKFPSTTVILALKKKKNEHPLYYNEEWSVEELESLEPKLFS